MKMIAVIRLSVPYTGMILTAREPVALRNEAIGYGISQIDAGSNVGIGGYSLSKDESDKRSQFCLSDDRPLDEVVGELCEAGFCLRFAPAATASAEPANILWKSPVRDLSSSFAHPTAF